MDANPTQPQNQLIIPPKPGDSLQVPRLPSLKELAATHRARAVEVLKEVMEDDEDRNAQIKAANSLLDRSDGKAIQYIEQTTKVQSYQDLLQIVVENEGKFLEVTDAVEVKQIPPLTWDDVV
jgi:hypothetical protein